MTTLEMAQAIGKPVLYESHGLQFVCVVVDIKVSYGQPRFLITPMKGRGQTWVEIGTISPMPTDRDSLYEVKMSTGGVLRGPGPAPFKSSTQSTVNPAQGIDRNHDEWASSAPRFYPALPDGKIVR